MTKIAENSQDKQVHT
uniref:Uncharacterized protein n=1 Tax=Arundo donax TaxID=35708 RepID=A0A0A8Y2N2_ARUDO